MQKYRLLETQLSSSLNEIELLNFYKQVPTQTERIQVLSRLKQILVQIPNEIETDPSYMRECNDRYYCFIGEEINENLKREKPESMKLLFHVVSLRIKFWFNRQEFDDLFNVFMYSVQHNRMMTPLVVDFLIELVDTFESDNLAQSQSLQKKPIPKSYMDSNSRLSLTRKTNNSLFSDQLINRKTWRATRQLNQSMNKKQTFTKGNRFQREFSDFELNKILIFANEVFNRSMVQNPNYDENQDQDLYMIKTSHPNILRTLTLIHNVLTYDFFGDRKDIEREQNNEKMPIIIPTKYSKHCKFHEFDNWIRNKNDFYRYQYLYLSTNNTELKSMIVRIFGDLLRIHQKFFKKEIAFKVHVENVLAPIKCLLENTRIEHSNDFDLALAFGETINKLLASSVFPTFLNFIKPDFKKQLLETIEQFIHKDILDQGLIDVSMVREFVGFFVEIIEKLSINSSQLYKVTDLKDDIETSIKRIGQSYEEMLHKMSPINIKSEYEQFIGFDDSVDMVNLEYFKEFFNFFKFFPPRIALKDANTMRKKCIGLCSKSNFFLNVVEFCVYQFESLSRFQNLSLNEQKKKLTMHRHLMQCFSKLIEFMSEDPNFQQQDSNYDLLVHFKTRLLMLGYFGEKLLNSKHNLMLIFDETEFLHKFTKVILELIFDIKLQSCRWDHNQIDFHEINTVYQYALELLGMALKINEKLLSDRTKLYADMEKINLIKNKIKGKHQIYEKEAKDLQQSLKTECQMILKELRYFENLIRQIKECFTENINIEQIEDSSFENISLKALYRSISQKQFQAVLQPIYRLYFLSVQKYELHRRKHQKLTAKNEKQEKQQNPEFNSLQLAEDEFIQEVPNEDQCSVIEESEIMEEIVFNTKVVHSCSSEIQLHNVNDILNPIAYFVYLEFVNQHESLKSELLTYFKNHFKKTKSFQRVSGENNSSNEKSSGKKDTSNQKQTNKKNLSNEKINGSNEKRTQQILSTRKRSYNQIYDIKTILKKLSEQFYQYANDQQNPIEVELKYYLLKIISNLLKIFKQCRFELEMKKELITSVFPFVNGQFESIMKGRYKFEAETEEMEQDRLMATKVESMVGLLEELIGIHFSEEKTNLYNLEFLILFPSQASQTSPDKKILKTSQLQHQQIVQVFSSTQRISRLFNTVLTFILNFPETYLQNGFYPLIQTQLTILIREIYFEFSQFITIYLFCLSIEDWSEKVVELMDVHKVVLEEENSLFEKYAVKVNEENLPCVIWAHTVLLKYVEKVMYLSYHSPSKVWLDIRNKELLPFMKQLILFFERLINEPQTLKVAFEQEFVDENMGECYFTFVVKKFYSTLFEFLKYFLTKFQDLTISFITEHLSFIECAYEMIKVGKGMGEKGVGEYIEREISLFDEMKIFRYAQDNNNNEKKPSRKSRIQSSCKQYKGWQYIQRLAITDQTFILQQLQDYQTKCKYYIKCPQQIQYSQTVTMKQSSQHKSLSANQSQVSARKSKQIIQSIRKSSGKKSEGNWADLEDFQGNLGNHSEVIGQGELELKGIDERQISSKKKGEEKGEFMFEDEYQMLVRDQFEDYMIQHSNSLMMEIQQDKQSHVPNHLDQNNDYQEEQNVSNNFLDPQQQFSLCISSNKHQNYDEPTIIHNPDITQDPLLKDSHKKNIQNQNSYYGQDEDSPLSNQLSEQLDEKDYEDPNSSPIKPQVVPGDDLTTYDIIESNDEYLTSSGKERYNYEEDTQMDVIDQVSEREINSASQGQNTDRKKFVRLARNSNYEIANQQELQHLSQSKSLSQTQKSPQHENPLLNLTPPNSVDQLQRDQSAKRHSEEIENNEGKQGL